MPFERGFGDFLRPVQPFHTRSLHRNWLDRLLASPLATLPTRPNPSSVHVMTPYTRTALGRQMLFGRHFTTRSTAAGSLSTEFGWNSNFRITIPTGVTGLPIKVDMGTHDFPEAEDLARHLEVLLNDHPELGTSGTEKVGIVWTVRFDADTLKFTISATYAFKLSRYSIANGESTNNAGLETLSFLESETSTAQLSHTGHRTNGTEVWIVWDTGEFPGFLGRENASMHARAIQHGADWFAVRDLNFDLGARDVLLGPSGATSDAFDVARGYPKLVLYASNDLTALEQWTEQDWTEGLDKFTFVDESITDPTQNPVVQSCMRLGLFGTDGRSWLQTEQAGSWLTDFSAGTRPTLLRHQALRIVAPFMTSLYGIFPCRQLTAYLRGWAQAYGEKDGPLVGSNAISRVDGRATFRYWMLMASNPNNVSGRLAIGPHALSSGFYWQFNPVDGSMPQSIDRDTLQESEFGVMVGRAGQPGRELQVDLAFATEADIELFQQTCPRARANDVRLGAPHGIAYSRTIGGKHKPFFVMQPLFGPATKPFYFKFIAPRTFSLLINKGGGGTGDHPLGPHEIALWFDGGGGSEQVVFVELSGLEASSPEELGRLIRARIYDQWPLLAAAVALDFEWLENRQAFAFTSTGGGIIVDGSGLGGGVVIDGPLPYFSAWPLLGFDVDYQNTSGLTSTHFGQIPGLVSHKSTAFAEGTIFAHPDIDPSDHQFLDLYSQKIRFKEVGEGT